MVMQHLKQTKQQHRQRFQLLLDSIANAGKYGDALDVLYGMRTRGLQPNGTHHLSALRACRVAAEAQQEPPRLPRRSSSNSSSSDSGGGGGNVDAARKARRLLLRMRKKTNEGQLACPRGYEETLRTLAAAGRAKDALEVMLWMREDAVTPESRHLAYAAVALTPTRGGSHGGGGGGDGGVSSRIDWLMSGNCAKKANAMST